jgi:hypothetical protein
MLEVSVDHLLGGFGDAVMHDLDHVLIRPSREARTNSMNSAESLVKPLFVLVGQTFGFVVLNRELLMLLEKLAL